MKVEIDNFIGVFDDVVTKEYCDYLINFFDNMKNYCRSELEKFNDTKLKGLCENFKLIDMFIKIQIGSLDLSEGGIRGIHPTKPYF